MLTLSVAWMLATAPVIDNDFVGVSRNESRCTQAAAPRCGHRVIVAVEAMEVVVGSRFRRLARGEVLVLEPQQSYEVSSGRDFFEVVIRPDHPPAIAPADTIAPEKNALLYENDDFFVFAEKLDVGDTRPRHSHSQRVVIQLNRTQLRQWPDGRDEVLVETVPGKPSFSPPVVHKVTNAGDQPLFGIIVEFKPRPAP